MCHVFRLPRQRREKRRSIKKDETSFILLLEFRQDVFQRELLAGSRRLRRLLGSGLGRGLCRTLCGLCLALCRPLCGLCLALRRAAGRLCCGPLGSGPGAALLRLDAGIGALPLGEGVLLGGLRRTLRGTL